MTLAGVVLVFIAGAAWWQWKTPAPLPALSAEERAALFATPLEAPEAGSRKFYLGHSLIGPNIPAFVDQLAEVAGFRDPAFHSQLGWGTSLREHWYPSLPINGFAEMNDSPAHAPAKPALESGGYDVLVITEMVDLKDAIRWHESGRYAGFWAGFARQNRADMRIYLYETWHGTDIPEGWLERIDADLPALWEGTIMAQAKATPDVGVIHLIPAGQAMAAFTRALEAQGGLPGLADRHGLFALNDDGTRDTIHPNDLGSYLVALVHFATLYHMDPRGLPHELTRADGTPAEAPSPEVAALMQQVAWDVVRSLPQTGVAP
ncbi:MAG: hypothetical protein JJU07_05830 [Natronohydrobacter sp.]|nr:hypothetical protein [Natronohydrobacter sp.]